MAHYECKYCDRPQGYMGSPITINGDKVCVCGAEWEDAKILVDDEVDPNENLEILSCGCFQDHGCSCPDIDYDDLPCGCSKNFGCECFDEEYSEDELEEVLDNE